MPGRIREFIGWCRTNRSLAARGAVLLAVVAAVASLLTYLVADRFGLGSPPRLAAALQQARRAFAEQAELRQRLERSLYQSLVSEVQAVRVLRHPGWRWYALERIEQAAKLDTPVRDAVALRSSALAILVEPDVLSLAALKGHKGPIRCVAFSPDGDHLATGSSDGTICFWNVLSGELLHTLPVGSPLSSLSFDAPGLHLIATADDGVVRSWRTGDWDEPRILTGGDDRTTMFSISPDGSVLATALADGSVQLSDMGSGDPVATLRGAAAVRCLAWGPDGRWLAAGAADNIVHIWDVSAKSEREPCTGHTAPIAALAVRSDGSSIVAASTDGTVRMWQPDTGTPLGVWQTSGGPALSLATRPDVPELAIGSNDGSLRLLNPITGEERLLAREHTAPVTSLAFSPDGSMLVSGSVDTTARLHAVALGTERTRYRAHFSDLAEVQSLDFSPCGRWLASGATDASIALFPTQADLPDRLHTHGTVLAAAYSPDGTEIAVGCKDRDAVIVWQVASGEVRRVFWGHSGGVLAVSWSSDGRTIASGSEDGTVRLWDASSGSAGPILKGHTAPVNSVAFSPDGRYVASGSFDRTVRIWPCCKAESACEAITVGEHNGYVLCVAWRDDGHMLASASADHLIKLWKLSGVARGPAATNDSSKAMNRIRGREAAVLFGHTSHVFSVAFSPDGTLLASGSNDRTMRIWDVSRRQSLASVPAHSAKLLAVAYDPRGELVASAAEDGTVRVWSLRGLRRAWTARPHDENAASAAPAIGLFASLTGHSLGVPALKFSPNGQELLTGSWDRSVRLWTVRAIDSAADAANGSTPAQPSSAAPLQHTQTIRPRRVLAGRTASPPRDSRPAVPIRLANGVVLGLAVSPDGKRLAVGSKEPSLVSIWDLERHSIVRQFAGHTADVMAVAWSPDGRIIVSASEDATVRLWDADTGQQLAVIRDHAGKVNTVAFHPNGRLLASGSFDRTIRLWEVVRDTQETSVRPITQLQAHASWVLGLAFSGDGFMLASASADSTVRVWRLNGPGDGSIDAAELTTMKGHTGMVYAVSFSPDSSLIASAGDDGTVRIWEATSGTCRQIATGHAARVYAVCFSPDGVHVASGSFDHAVRLWDVGSGRSVAALGGHRAAVPALAFDQAGRLISGSWDRTIRVWDIDRGLTEAMLGSHSEPVVRVALLPDGKRLASATLAGSVRVCDVAQLGDAHENDLAIAKSKALAASGVRDVLRGSQHTLLIVQETTEILSVQDAESGQVIVQLAAAESPISSLASWPDGRLLATGHLDGHVRIYTWNADDATTEIAPRPADHTIAAHRDPVRSLALAPSSSGTTELASTSKDAVVKLWTVHDGTAAADIVGGTAFVSAIAFSSQGDLLAVSREDGIVELWDRTRRQWLAKLPADRRAARAIAFSLNDRFLATGGNGPMVTLWNLGALRGQLSELGLDW